MAGPSTASNLASLGHGSNLASPAYTSIILSLPIALSFVELREYQQGTSNEPFNYYGVPTAAAESEGAAAPTISDWPTITQVTIAPAGYVGSLGYTSPARDRVGPGVNLAQDTKELLLYALGIFPQTLSVTGLAVIMRTDISQSVGTSGAAWTLEIVENGCETVLGNPGHHAHTVSVFNGFMAKQLRASQRASASAYLANVAADEWVKEIISSDPLLRKGYFGSTNSSHNHLFMEAQNSFINSSGGDYYGCCFIPSVKSLKAFAGMAGVSVPAEILNVAPAFGGVAKSDPDSVMQDLPSAFGRELIPSTFGKVSIMPRHPVGSAQGAVFDARGSSGVDTIRAQHACKLVSVAS